MGKIHILGWDKLIHVVQYLVLALLVNRCLVVLKASRRTALLLYMALMASAALDEWHQTLIPNRTVNVWDFAANAVGLGLGYFALRRKHDPGKQTLAQH